MPKIGKELISTGSKAQCMAQATDVPIPIASQLIFIFILKKRKDSIFAITLQVLICLIDFGCHSFSNVFGVALQKMIQ